MIPNTKKLQKILDDAVASGEECGCQLAVFKDGKPILSLSAGFTAPDRSQPVDENTIFPIFSCGKSIAATAVHRLVEKGTLRYDDRVADYWPEFGCNGKEDIRLWHLLSHRAALFETPPTDSVLQWADWNLMCSKLAEMKPAWKPGTKSAYHGITFAWLIGETASRADGRPFRQIVEEEVLRPLHLDSFFFGTTPEADARFAPVDMTGAADPNDWRKEMNTPEYRHGFIPSFNAITNAFSLAKYYSALLGKTDGIRLLKPETVARAATLCRAADDPIPPEGTWAKFGLGYALSGPPENLSRMFGQGGALGAEGFADRETGLALGFTKNRINRTHPVHPVRDRISEAFGLPLRHW